MDIAVDLVEAYLRVNGYLTVTEYPILEAKRTGQVREATDLDLLAFRFPGAGRYIPRRDDQVPEVSLGPPDPALGAPEDEADMLVCEVKQGEASMNRAAWDPDVLEVALVRFGCCPSEHVEDVVEQLLEDGTATTPAGHRVRMLAVGATRDPEDLEPYQFLALGHVVEHLRSYLDEHWDVLSQGQFRTPAMAFLALASKLDRA